MSSIYKRKYVIFPFLISLYQFKYKQLLIFEITFYKNIVIKLRKVPYIIVISFLSFEATQRNFVSYSSFFLKNYARFSKVKSLMTSLPHAYDIMRKFYQD